MSERMKQRLILTLLSIMVFGAKAQDLKVSDSLKIEPVSMTGKIWGYAFGDYFYKAHSDSLGRGGSNQYTKTKTGDNAFAFRRIYMGYNFDINEKFSAEVLLAAEDWSQEKNLSFFVKYANLRWKNVWKGTDLVLGQSGTPGFSKSSEKFWSYRSVERTLIDIRRTQSYDFGVSLQGMFDEKGNYGYNAMIGNGTGALAENDRFKKFYGNVYGYFLDKKLLLDVYADYERVDWQKDFHHSRTMLKVFAGYTTPSFTLGAEAFLNHAQQDIIAAQNGMTDTLNANSIGGSVFVRGKVIDNKLNFFARMDVFNPYVNYDRTKYQSYQGLSKNYNPNTKEKFITAGLDFTPTKNVHFMPNVWINTYQDQNKEIKGKAGKDYDLVYRLTFYYVFGR